MTTASRDPAALRLLDVAMRNQERFVFDSDEHRLESFARALDAIRKEVEADLGAKDLAHIERIATFSHRMEWLGRGLVHFSFEPFGFSFGVGALWLHKILELMEIGHTVLHGTYDRIPGADAYRSTAFRWKAPIEEESWRAAHNVRHHQYTNVAERDPDLDFGALRLSGRIPYKRVHRLQPLSNLLTWFAFASAINVHATGIIDVYARRHTPHALPDRSWRSIKAAHQRSLSKFARYYGREYVLFPLLAGPFFWKTLLGNALSDVGRDLFAAATIYCGHVGASDYPTESRAGGRARWYVMQVEASRDFEVSERVSILCGALNRQIEHHLFPRVPPNRLREIAPRVRAVCDAHGVRYRTDSWGRTLRDVLRGLHALSSPRVQDLVTA